LGGGGAGKNNGNLAGGVDEVRGAGRSDGRGIWVGKLLDKLGLIGEIPCSPNLVSPYLDAGGTGAENVPMAGGADGGIC
jgi:hypothetical protein